MGTIIKNAAILDLTQASEETLKEIKAIKNVAIMVYNEKFEPYMSRITFHDIASSVKVSGKFTSINGKLEFNKNYAAGMKEPIFFLVNGKVIVKPDVTTEMIDQAINGLYLNGKIYCPESIQGALQQKINQNNGKMFAYMDNAMLETGKITLNDDYLKVLDPKTNLAAADKVTMIEDVTPSLLDEKINRIQFLKEAVISQSNREKLSGKLKSPTDTIVTVPEGFTYIDGDLHLDSDALSRYQQAKLLIIGAVHFDEKVTPEEVNQHIAEIQTDETIYCRTELKAAVLQKCQPTVKIVSYSGTLRIVNGEYKLTQPELDYTEGKLTFIVHGVLEIDKKVDPKALFDKLERIDLNGVASGTPEQCGVLQTKLGIKNGVIDDGEKDRKENKESVEDQNPDDTYITNVAYLKL